MHTIPLLEQLALILCLSTAVVALFHRLNIPAILGFLITGIIIGPNGLEWIREVHNIELLAEIGVILLLFTIGIEFSLKELVKMRTYVLGGGTMQLLATTACVGLVLWLWGQSAPLAIFIGLLIPLSSTAIVLKLLGERGEMASMHGRMILGILLFQDLAIIVLVLLVPMLAGKVSGVQAIAWGIAKAILVIGGILVVASRLVPWLFARVVQTRSRELFSLMTVLVIFGAALLTGYAGLSLAIGAFVSGMVVSESIYAQQMLSEILPFKDIFNGIFFVSVGMLADVSLLLEFPLMIPLAVCALVLIKAGVGLGIARILGGGWGVGIQVGLGIAQVGEFAFVLALQGRHLGLLDAQSHSIFLMVAVLSMLLTPLLLDVGSRLGARLSAPTAEESPDPHLSELPTFTDHAVIVGYGINGRNVALALRKMGVPYVVIELNGGTVTTHQALGEHIFFGDAGRGPILSHARLPEARVLVITSADAASARQICANARKLAPSLPILVRTRFIAEVEELRELGATVVIPEEFETSLHLTALVMRQYGASSQLIWRKQETLRKTSYELMRAVQEPVAIEAEESPDFFDLMRELELGYLTLHMDMESAHQTIAETQLRAETGAVILGVVRQRKLQANPGGTFALEPGDRLILSGLPEQLQKAIAHLGRRR